MNYLYMFIKKSNLSDFLWEESITRYSYIGNITNNLKVINSSGAVYAKLSGA